MESVISALERMTPGQALERKYRHLRPVYLPYPGAERMQQSFGHNEYVKAATGAGTQNSTLRLMAHVPRLDVHNESRRFYAALDREIAMQGALFDRRATIEQWDFGAAARQSSDAQLVSTIDRLHQWFSMAADSAGHASISVDVETSTPARIKSLRGMGFNELNIESGVGGSRSGTAELMARARSAGYHAVQISVTVLRRRLSEFALARILKDILPLRPDRVALHGQEVRDLHAKLLNESGYRLAAVDLFIRAEDRSALTGLFGLARRFPQGDCRLTGPDLLGVGVSAVSMLGAGTSQNADSIARYCQLISGKVLPVVRGTVLSNDQLLRRAVMQMLLCDFSIFIDCIEQVFGIDFCRYFRHELTVLRAMQQDGLLSWEGRKIWIEPKGLLLARSICSIFA